MRFFYMHIGSFVAVIVYFTFAGGAEYSPAGVRTALIVALALETAYIWLARRAGELKHFDVSLWLLFATGALATTAGFTGLARLFEYYSPALIFTTLGLTALLPPLLGGEPFTYYYARRQTPAWQQRLPEFVAINRVMTGYWAIVFFTAAALAAAAPTDWRYTALFPNLLTFGAGMTATWWLPLLYLKLFPPALPTTIEPLLLGMPLAFDRKAAGDDRAVIQFRVSGPEAGTYHVHVDRGRCRSFTGEAPAPDLVVHTPDSVWMRIARGELDGGEALQQGLYHIDGDLAVLAKMKEWFNPRRGARRSG